MKRIVLILTLLFVTHWVTLAQRPEPKLEGYMAPDGTFLSVEAFEALAAGGGAPTTLVAKYMQVYATAPNCVRKGQFYFDSVIGHQRNCTATGTPGTWETITAGGAGTVTSVSVTTANGVSGSVATATTTPAITLTLGAITPSSISSSGSASFGVGGSNAGAIDFTQGTAAVAGTSSVGFMAPASVTTKFRFILPAAPTTGVMIATGATDPSTISMVAPGSSGNVLTSNGTTWASTAPAAGGITNSAGANVLMKSDGTNAGASTFADSGTSTTMTVNQNAGTTLSVINTTNGTGAYAALNAGATATTGLNLFFFPSAYTGVAAWANAGVVASIGDGTTKLVLNSRDNAPIEFYTNSTGGTPKWSILSTGHLTTPTDNTYDIGASGATRPRTGYFGTSIAAPTSVFTGTYDIATPTGAIRIQDATNNNKRAIIGYDPAGSGFTFISSGNSGVSNTPVQINDLLQLGYNAGGGSGGITFNSDNTHDIGRSGAVRPANVYVGTSVVSTAYQTTTNCADSAGAAACGSAASGAVVIDAAATTVVVSTTAVTANSQIHVTFDSSLGTRLGITCNATFAAPWVSARTAATSFTISVGAAPATNPACYNYTIIN